MKYIKEENKIKEEEKLRKKNENTIIKSKFPKEDVYNSLFDDIKKEQNYKVLLDVIPTVLEFS
jgi:hypothetical protein